MIGRRELIRRAAALFGVAAVGNVPGLVWSWSADGGEWSVLLTPAQMLAVVAAFVPGRGRYRFGTDPWTRWYPEKRLLNHLGGEFTRLPLLAPLLMVQRESDREFIEIQRVAA